MADNGQTASLEEVSQRLERIEGMLARLDASMARTNGLVAQAPAAAATLTDIVDEWAARANNAGVDIDRRIESALGLLERLTEPAVADALGAVLDRIERVKILVEQADALPGVIAMVADIADGFLLRAAERGLDIESVVATVADIAARFARLLQSPELRAVLASGILDPEVIRVVGQLGAALGEARNEDGGRAGWMAIWRASRDPNVQRTLDFSVRFLRHLGTQLDQAPATALAPSPRKELASV